MLFTLLALLAGVGLGVVCAGLPRDHSFHSALSVAGRVAAALLLFCIGLWMGGNPDFWGSLQVAGGAGVLLALAASAGSVCLGWLVARRFFPEDKS